MNRMSSCRSQWGQVVAAPMRTSLCSDSSSLRAAVKRMTFLTSSETTVKDWTRISTRALSTAALNTRVRVATLAKGTTTIAIFREAPVEKSRISRRLLSEPNAALSPTTLFAKSCLRLIATGILKSILGRKTTLRTPFLNRASPSGRLKSA